MSNSFSHKQYNLQIMNYNKVKKFKNNKEGNIKSNNKIKINNQKHHPD